MLGGEGGARTLYGKAIVRVKLTRADKHALPRERDAESGSGARAHARLHEARAEVRPHAAARLVFGARAVLWCVRDRIDTGPWRSSPASTLPYDEEEWRDALVTVESGEIELEMTCGRSCFFQAGDLLWFQGLPLASLRNRGHEPAVLVAATRNRELR